MDLSNSLKYGTVVWTALSALVDSETDTDRDPNNTPIPNITVTFIASAPRIVIQDPYPITIFLESVTARTNQHGVLVGPDGVEGIKLIASDNVKATPVNFTYRVNISGHGVPITVDISVPSDGVIDLSFLVPVLSSPGKVLAPERGPQGIEGPPPELAVGTVKPTDDSAKAAAYFRPNPDGGQFLDLDLPIGPQGAKGDPGGWLQSTDLGTTDLDTVTAPGLYRASSAANVTAERHYPIVGAKGTGVLEVIWQGGTVTQAKIQRYTIVWGDHSAKVIFVRHYLSSAWGPWERFLSHKHTTDANGFKHVSIYDDITGTDVSIAGPGGLTRPQKLGAANLNRLYSPGFYEQSVPAYAILENGYPSKNLGTLRVEARLMDGEQYGPSVIQTYTPVVGVVNNESRVEYKRSCNGVFSNGELNWSPWMAHVAQRVDNTAGLAIYTWDSTANREQLIYGDSGWRDIKGLLGENYKSGVLLFRRSNYMVELAFEVLQFNEIPADRFIKLPLPNANSIAELYVPLSTPNYTLSAIHSFNASWGGNHRIHLGAGSDAISGYCSYPVRNRWPETLPGIASGTITNV